MSACWGCLARLGIWKNLTPLSWPGQQSLAQKAPQRPHLSSLAAAGVIQAR